jgi:WD40 repeat protein
VVTGSDDKTAKVWDFNTGKLLHTLSGHLDWIRSVVISSDNAKLATGSGDNTTKIWDLNTGKLLYTLSGH